HKLKQVPELQRPQAIETIAELGRMYGEYNWQTDEAKEFWSMINAESGRGEGKIRSEERRVGKEGRAGAREQYRSAQRTQMAVYGRRFFFQAEDGIRARNVTGVQTCALPISQA